ncbi:winged helix-turn-helix transcriptional regulator [Halobellus rarus]|uniref:Winged helix-turn-helix transcriptional regulator n=1 Tax=Halobellus rarus TaxID=1126237 RepID=A0ABD6CM54_9EURY|nr:helix-turn-helix domain-containing protein [Halobellus rarus]
MGESEQWQAKWHGLQDVLGPKWTLHILRLLSDDPYGFNAIQRELDGLTAPMLSRRLKELRCHGLVERTVADTTPPETTYSLTEQGTEIATRLRELEPLFELHDQEAENATIDCSTPSQECRGEALENGCVTVTDRC